MYQIVAADARAPRDGKFLEVLGTYQPTAKPHAVTLKKERVAYWIETGAQPTDTVRSLIQATGLLHELRLKSRGFSDADITAEMERWQENKLGRIKKRLAVKSRRRQAKKDAEAQPAAAVEAVAAAPVEAPAPAAAPVAEAEPVAVVEAVVETPVAPVVEAPVEEAPAAPVAEAESPEGEPS